jgi:hypothetical protein
LISNLQPTEYLTDLLQEWVEINNLSLLSLTELPTTSNLNEEQLAWLEKFMIAFDCAEDLEFHLNKLTESR